MGWIAKPGSAEDRLNKWLDRLGLSRFALWCSALLSVAIAWNLYDVLPPNRKFLTAIPVAFGFGACAVARHLGKVERPGLAAWLAALFFSTPLLLQVAESSGLFDLISRFALPG
ncbi:MULTISPECIES: hypothetical protein [unclassified Sphingomonas]|uniref:hypothetical protein n=1 Tax=unclassified Sphingomonas TaxID=196159 RepID=UPI0012E0F33F|nr:MULTISPECIES: hypothetical protein [unclassified Sphingomonas]